MVTHTPFNKITPVKLHKVTMLMNHQQLNGSVFIPDRRSGVLAIAALVRQKPHQLCVASKQLFIFAYSHNNDRKSIKMIFIFYAFSISGRKIAVHEHIFAGRVCLHNCCTGSQTGGTIAYPIYYKLSHYSRSPVFKMVTSP